jgi:DNA invertase Pin-like site-specific DNA recombinase
MPTLLDGILETHDGPEPRVLTADVQSILREVIRPDDEDSGKSVALIAEKARISTRTVYRVLQGDKEPIGLDLADRLCLAAESHLAHCRLVWPDQTITPYTHCLV